MDDMGMKLILWQKASFAGYIVAQYKNTNVQSCCCHMCKDKSTETGTEFDCLLSEDKQRKQRSRVCRPTSKQWPLEMFPLCLFTRLCHVNYCCWRALGLRYCIMECFVWSLGLYVCRLYVWCIAVCLMLELKDSLVFLFYPVMCDLDLFWDLMYLFEYQGQHLCKLY